MKICDCCSKSLNEKPIIIGLGHEICDKCFEEFVVWRDNKYHSQAPANIQQQVQPDGADKPLAG